jgi:DNA helicase IV
MEVLEENKYLKNVVLKQIDKFIEKTKKEQEFYRSEVENMGIPDLEQKGYFKRCKENVFKCEEKINKLKQFRKNTHFGRMDLDLIEDGNKENITMYLGEKSINDGIINLVYDWRSPVGNLYYMNAQETFKFNDTLYNLNLRRQIEIENAEVINVYNSYVRGRNMNITDDFLLKVVSKIRSYDGVLGIHDLVVHSYGENKTFISVHVEVDADGNITESHDVIDNIEADFLKENN